MTSLNEARRDNKEAAQIALIAAAINAHPPGFVVGVAVDNEAKADRYLKKIQELVPAVIEKDRAVILFGAVVMKLVKQVVQ